MRLTRYHLFLLGGLFLMVMGPLAFTQPGPGGGKGGKGKGPSPDFMFMMLSGGNDTFEVSKVQLRQWGNGPTVEEQRQQLLTFLQKKGITNGVMTKAVFPEYWEERMVEMRAKREAEKQGGGAPPAPGATPSSAGSQDPDAQAREQFALHDTDKNGSLSVVEMQAAGKRGSRILEELSTWDTNKNGTIELPEYIEYYRARMAKRGTKGGPNPPASIPEPIKPIEEDKRPTVYRTGKMPKELPSWFEEADTDKDGQVGLYEWKASGKSVREFLAMDLNGDGFLTVEEVLRYQRVSVKSTDTSTFDSAGAPSSAGTRDPAGKGDAPRGRGGFGGRPKGGRSKGG